MFDELRITVSQVEEYLHCPMKHFFRYIVKRTPEDEVSGPGLSRGKAFHEVMEDWLKMRMAGTDFTDPLYWAERLTPPDPDALKIEDARKIEALALRGAWFVKRGGFPWDEVLCVEQEQDLEIGTLYSGNRNGNAPVQVILMTRPDVFVRDDRGVWSVQWKTHSGGLEEVVADVENSLHEATYSLTAPYLFPTVPFVGTMLGSFSTMPIHTREKGAECSHCAEKGLRYRNPEEAVKVQFLPLADGVPQRAFETIQIAAKGILSQKVFYASRIWDASSPPFMPPPSVALQNPSACIGKYGRVCGFRKGPCNEAGTVMDQLRYVTLDPNAHHEKRMPGLSTRS
jgi:PD-(D/E)XK nuclease superfamily protein